ncbi:MAG: metal-dependent hydrolase [Blastopirellula sp.]|nr:MAG: metal-dependent hydrolase [Blastopirellula sp.]
MANGNTHICAGCAVGLVVACLDKDETSNPAFNPLVTGGTGALFGKLPDLLEPAIHSHHRQFFHSWLVFGAVGYGFKKIYEWKPDDPIEVFLREVALMAAGGYMSHLFLDSLTPRSLPLLGKF